MPNGTNPIMPSDNSEYYSPLAVSAVIFLSSFLACFLPKFLGNTLLIKEYFPVVNVFTAGLQLATMTVDLIPHMGLKNGAHLHENDFYPFVAIGFCFLSLVAIDSIFLHKEAKHEHSNGKACAGDHHHHKESLGTCNTNAITNSKTKTQALLFLLAISIHSFLEGLALNIDAKRIPLLAGLLFHKILESFAVGTSTHHSIFSKNSKVSLLFIYSLFTPIAILARNMKIFTAFANAQQWFNALCLGALMFVVFFEVIGHSFHGGKNTKKKILSIFLGYTLGSAAIVLAHGHDHHHHHHHH